MKKHTFRTALVLLVILAMIVPCLPVVASAADPTIETRTAEAADKAWYDEHTSDTTLYIGSTGELAYFMELGAQATAVTFEGKTIQLTADIVWNYGEATADGFTPDTGAQGNVIYDWTPYGKNDSTNSFQGTFDGNGKRILGLYINRTTENSVAFMKFTGEGAEIKNLSLENVYVAGKAYASALVAQPKGSLTLRNVNVSCYVAGASYTGGLISYPDNSTGNKITIEKCVVKGLIVSTHTSAGGAGGFIGMSRLYEVSVSDSICYADINVAGMFAGGFIGVGVDKLSFDKCYYFGKITYGNATYKVYSGAFAGLLRNKTTISTTSNVISEGAGTVNLTDCYFMEGSAAYALGVHAKTPQFNVTVSYADGTEGTYDCTTASDDTAAKKSTAMTNLFKTVSLAAKDTEVVAYNGVQLRNNGSTFDARFVSTIDFDETLTKSNISEVGIEIAILNEFAAGTAEAVKTKSCDKVYKSIKSSYGMGTITAGEGDYTDVDYLATLVVRGIPTSGTQTFVVRTYCKVGETYHYGSYAAVTFINGAFAASKTVATA